MSSTIDSTRTVGGRTLPTPGPWTIDTAHSTVEFVARHLVVTKVRGRFTDWSAELVIGERPEEVTDMARTGKGEVVAELDVKPDLWFFACHFKGDPVMPGCLGLDGLWQLLGFFLGWMKAPGRGRALGVGEVKFTGMVLPTAKKITYIVNLKRVIMRKLVMGIADARMELDGREIYVANDLRVGLFTSTDNF